MYAEQLSRHSASRLHVRHVTPLSWRVFLLRIFLCPNLMSHFIINLLAFFVWSRFSAKECSWKINVLLMYKWDMIYSAFIWIVNNLIGALCWAKCESVSFAKISKVWKLELLSVSSTFILFLALFSFSFFMFTPWLSQTLVFYFSYQYHSWSLGTFERSKFNPHWTCIFWFWSLIESDTSLSIFCSILTFIG